MSGSPASSGRRGWPLILGATVTVGLFGCAALAPLHGPTPTPRLAIERGARLASTECAACHAIGPEGAHPATAAPDFGAIAGRYRDLRLDWELEAISQVGHYRMARKALTAAEIADLTAYIRTLDLGADPNGR